VHRFTRAAAAAALLAMIAGCGATVASSQPPARIAAHAGIFSAFPSACSLVNPPTLKTLDLQATHVQQTDVQQGGAEEKTCAWGSVAGGHDGTRSLILIADLFTAATGQAPATAAEDHFQQNTSDQAQADGNPGHAVSGLANEAFTDQVTRSGESQSQVTVRDQNVLVTVNYGVMAADGEPNAASAAGSGALTAARAALSALPGS
jgi:hypothetical protein